MVGSAGERERERERGKEGRKEREGMMRPTFFMNSLGGASPLRRVRLGHGNEETKALSKNISQVPLVSFKQGRPSLGGRRAAVLKE